MKTNIKTLLTFSMIIASISFLSGQQNVKGMVIDQQSELPLIGATVMLIQAGDPTGEITDADGLFTIADVPYGRHSIEISYLGYETSVIPNIEVVAGKETYIEIALEESIESLDEVVIIAQQVKDKPQNELATVSARTFSLEEVNRYSGGRNDVARLVSNFAGVSTSNDSRNDIVIRGNSPTGVLWRLEGIPIPNPNHFSTLGTTGGPVSAINPNVLKNSDFMTSAFPAEYGNAIAGVFDLGLRSGNKDKSEYTFQLGAFSGLEGMIEGPLGQNGGSYLIAGRYSFVGILGVGAGGTSAVPDYRDLAFTLDFGNGKLGKFSLFGIAGSSDIDFLHDDVNEDDLFSATDEDLLPRSGFLVSGLKHNLILGDAAYIRSILSYSSSGSKVTSDRYINVGEPNERKARFLEVDNIESRISLSSYYNQKINAKTSLRAGVLYERFNYNLYLEDAARSTDMDGDGINDPEVIYDFNESTDIVQPFAQIRYRLSNKWTWNGGVHAQYYSFNDDFALEPRLSLQYETSEKSTLTFGYSIHHQSQPLPILLNQYRDTNGSVVLSNQNLKFTRNQHLVLGYDWAFAPTWRIKLEAYSQSIDNVPVESVSSSFSMLNVGADFAFPTDKVDLVNEGTGKNQGVELTVEKFLSNGFYGLFTGTVYDSKYTGSDGVERNTAFNNRFVFNILGGREFQVGNRKKKTLTMDFRFTNAGGRYYTPTDLSASQSVGFEVLNENQAFSQRFSNYMRLDFKIGIKVNSPKLKLSQQFSLDFQNVLNRDNLFDLRYNRLTGEINEVNQIGFFPDVLYRLQF